MFPKYFSALLLLLAQIAPVYFQQSRLSYLFTFLFVLLKSTKGVLQHVYSFIVVVQDLFITAVQDVGEVVPIFVAQWLSVDPDPVLLLQVGQHELVFTEHEPLQLQVVYFVYSNQFPIKQSSKMFLLPDNPVPQVRHQLIVQIIFLQAILVCNVHVLTVLFTVVLGQRSHQDVLACLEVGLLVPKSETDAVVFVVKVGEPVPDQQEFVRSPAVAIENLLSLLVVSLSNNYEVDVAVIGTIPPIKLNIIFKFSIDQWLRFLKLGFQFFLSQFLQLFFEYVLLCLLLRFLLSFAIVVFRIGRCQDLGVVTLMEQLFVYCLQVLSTLGWVQSALTVIWTFSLCLQLALQQIFVFINVFLTGIHFICDWQLCSIIYTQQAQIYLLSFYYVLFALL